MSRRRISSDGSTGESMAELWFKRHGWVMHRHQPPTKVVYIDKRPTVIHCAEGRVPDYTGYAPNIGNVYRACECKEEKGGSMPCSRLTKKQREWMDECAPGCRYVAITWMDGETFCEVFPYKPKGSYKRGEGKR